MITKVPIVTSDTRLREVENLLIENVKNYNTINYIYVVNRNKKLKGVISIKSLFRLPKDKLVSEVMKNRLKTVRAYSDQERVAHIALKHNLKAIPVVDKSDHFLGIVPPDVILGILQNENIEDFLRYVGINDPSLSLIEASVSTLFKKRIPWLVFGLFGGFLSAFVVSSFREALRDQFTLAAFIPAVVYMADAVGSQSQIIFIRSLSLEQGLSLRKYITREINVVFLLSVVLSLMISIISIIGLRSPIIGVILGLSIFITVIFAMCVGILLPWLFKRFNYDPAIASDPFATAIRDISTLLIYFAIAQFMLNLV